MITEQIALPQHISSTKHCCVTHMPCISITLVQAPDQRATCMAQGLYVQAL